eukprot:symbB.v1.2.004045.t1/scaffold228.1/size260974/14
MWKKQVFMRLAAALCPLPSAFSLDRAEIPKFLAWAESIGVPSEHLQLPAWLQCLTEDKKVPEEENVPAFFSEPSSEQLMEYQKAGIRFGIARQGRILLADDMGLGKTVQAIGIAFEYQMQWPLLVICPSSLRNVWEQQLAKWTRLKPDEVQVIFSSATPIESTSRVVIVSYALLGKSKELQTFQGNSYKIVIADECHYIKNPDAQRSQALIKVASSAERIILVSGTPVLNSAMELYPLLQLLDPNIADKREFALRYFGGELHSYLFKTVGIRRKKEEVLSELPPKRRQTIMLQEKSSSMSMSKLKQMEAKLFKSSQDDDEIHEKSWWADLRTASELVMEAKKRCCADYVNEVINNGIGKFLLFAHHRKMLDSLEAVLKERVGGGGYMRIDGSTPQRERADLVTRFQEDLQCHVALLSITALAEGQTLTSAEAIIFAELVWTPGIILQCEGRAHRIGQKGSVLIQYLLLDGSVVDMRCHRKLEEKHKHAGKVLDNADVNLWEEKLHAEAGKNFAATGLSDRQKNRPKPFTAFNAHPKSRSAPSTHGQLSSGPAEGGTEHAKSIKHMVDKHSRSEPSFGKATSEAPSSSPGPCDPVYKVTDHLHLGLNLRIGHNYTLKDLEERCKGNEQKLGRLNFHVKDGQKLQLVTGNGGVTGGPPSKKPRL